MKTIQEYFRNANKESIIGQYLYQHPIDIQRRIETEMTITEAYDKRYKEIEKLIDKIINTKIIKTDEPHVFMTHHLLREYNGEDIRHVLLKLEDIEKYKKDNNYFIPSYGYSLTKIEESAGWFVADTYLTQYYLDDLLVDYLYESSWFGFEQEDIDETIEELNQSMEDIEKHKDDPDYFKSFNEVKEEIEEEFGFEFEERDPAEYEAFKECIRHEAEYCKTAFEIELKKLINSHSAANDE